MITVEQTVPREELSRRADEIYDTCIAAQMADQEPQWYLLIDVITGAYETDASEIAASDRLLARCPAAQVWMRRVGSHYGRRFGARLRSATK